MQYYNQVLIVDYIQMEVDDGPVSTKVKRGFHEGLHDL